MPLSYLRRLPFPRIIRELEHDMETVVKVLQPGPLGIVEHKFSADERKRAELILHRALENWRKVARIEMNSPILKDFIHKDASISTNSS